MDEIEQVASLFTPESIIHLTYEAGLEATERAVAEAEEASDWRKPRHDYVGHFVSLRRNRRGEPVLTLFCWHRGSAASTVGRYRSFNPKVGRLTFVKVVQPPASPEVPVGNPRGTRGQPS